MTMPTELTPAAHSGSEPGTTQRREALIVGVNGSAQSAYRSALKAAEADGRERLQALLHRRPRIYGKPSSRWTLALAAESSFAQVLLPPARSVASETSRLTLK
jgi:hypothetical protein